MPKCCEECNFYDFNDNADTMLECHCRALDSHSCYDDTFHKERRKDCPLVEHSELR